MTLMTEQAAVMAELRADNERLRTELHGKNMQIIGLNREVMILRAMQAVVDAKAPRVSYELNR